MTICPFRPFLNIDSTSPVVLPTFRPLWSTALECPFLSPRIPFSSTLDTLFHPLHKGIPPKKRHALVECRSRSVVLTTFSVTSIPSACNTFRDPSPPFLPSLQWTVLHYGPCPFPSLRPSSVALNPQNVLRSPRPVPYLALLPSVTTPLLPCQPFSGPCQPLPPHFSSFFPMSHTRHTRSVTMPTLRLLR